MGVTATTVTSPAPSASARHYLVVPLLAILWGFNWPAVRVILDEIPPWTLRTLGLSLAGAVLLLVALTRGQALAVPRRHWPRLLLAGTLSITAFNILLAFAQLSAPTSRAVIVTFTMPLWAVLFARPILGERLNRSQSIGLALGAAGLVALGWPLLVSGAWSVGLAYALLAGMAWALGTVMTKRAPVDASPLVFTGWQLMAGAVCAGFGMLLFEGAAMPRLPSPGVLAALAYHVLLSQALAYVLWFATVARLPAGTASLGTLMVPAVGVFGAVLILGERPTLTDWAGLALMLAAAASVLPLAQMRLLSPRTGESNGV
ncbi:DMT family transporter [Microvirga makkahensis]|uniref:EamA family transporter n=1 Tax=Microvirga makkahensis TaxID=1128670 RepID=A0A7X3MPE9_9HYPH|nr:DMT family transporter [Microvirga makkahensis]MXQ10782.1 EamA family transporter [Microvirga makkahensis]